MKGGSYVVPKHPGEPGPAQWPMYLIRHSVPTHAEMSHVESLALPALVNSGAKADGYLTHTET